MGLDHRGSRWPPYTAEQHTRALEVYARYGPREAARRLATTDIPVSDATLSRWAKEAGVRVTTQQRHVNEQARENAVAATRRNAAEARLYVAERLSTVAMLAVDREVEILQQPGQSLRDIVGAGTRAIHDLRLLSGESTENINASQDRLDVEAFAAQLEQRRREHEEDQDSA